jgi:hypothetical protein
MHTALSRITAPSFDLQSVAQFDCVFFREFMPKQHCKMLLRAVINELTASCITHGK